jgi:hypothetical protein
MSRNITVFIFFVSLLALSLAWTAVADGDDDDEGPSGTPNLASRLDLRPLYKGYAKLDADVDLFYTVNAADQTIQMAAIGKAKGYVCIGINSDDSSHLNTDMIIGYYGAGGGVVGDYWSTSKDEPDPDRNDILWSQVDESADGYTIVQFRRKLVTGDPKDNPIAIDQPTKILFALSNSDSDEGDHFATGLTMVTFTESGVAPKGPDPTAATKPDLSATYPRKITLRSGMADFFYRVDAAAGILYGGMQMKTTGWVCVGFNPSDSSHASSDMIVGSFSTSGGEVKDYWSTTKATPRLDLAEGGSNDIQWFKVDETADGWTTAQFKRALSTGDNFDRPLTVAPPPSSCTRGRPTVKTTSRPSTRRQRRGWSSSSLLTTGRRQEHRRRRRR